MRHFPRRRSLRIAAASGVAGLDVIVETVAASVAGGRWCSMEACGNRNKTRAYRRRRAD
jgi:predicted RNA-binding Zn ribbon-like protein